jgi:prophage regulatory protein
MIGMTALEMCDVSQRVSLSRSRIGDLIRMGQFPKPFKLGLRKNGWLESQVDRWLTLRATGKDWSDEVPSEDATESIS